MTKNDLILIMKYSDNLLNIVDNASEFTRSDLQGAIEAQVMMLLNEAKNL